jgi:hypothetical protein
MVQIIRITYNVHATINWVYSSIKEIEFINLSDAY